MDAYSYEAPDLEYKHKELPLYICKFKKISSTQLWAYKHIDLLVKDGKLSPNVFTLITADQMTSGIGSEDPKTGIPRKWCTLEGKNLNLTYVTLRVVDENVINTDGAVNNELGYSLKNNGFYALSLSLIVCNLLEEFGIDNAKIKWVNDIYVNNKKIGGIICKKLDKTYIFSGVKHEPFIVGIGLNVLHKENEIPINIEHPATSIILESKTDLHKLSVDNISEKLHFNVIKCITILNSNIDKFFTEKVGTHFNCGIFNDSIMKGNCMNKQNLIFAENKDNNHIYKELLLDEINKRLLYKGKAVYIEENQLLENDCKMGIFIGVDANGYAIIKSKHGNDTFILTHGRMKPLRNN